MAEGLAGGDASDSESEGNARRHRQRPTLRGRGAREQTASANDGCGPREAGIIVATLEAAALTVADSHRRVLEFLSERMHDLRSAESNNTELQAEIRSLRVQLDSASHSHQRQRRETVARPPSASRRLPPPPPPPPAAPLSRFAADGFPEPPEDPGDRPWLLMKHQTRPGQGSRASGRRRSFSDVPAERRPSIASSKASPCDRPPRTELPGAVLTELPPAPPEVDAADSDCSDASSHDRYAPPSRSSLATESRRTLRLQSRSNFEVLSVWKEHRFDLAAKVLARGLRRDFEEDNQMVFHQPNTMGAKDAVKNSSPSAFMVVHPYSKSRVIWDLLNLIMVLWDIVMIPFGLFDPPKTSVDEVMTWVTRIFWTIDMFWSFVTGFVRPDGSVEMGVCGIWRRYVTTWFGLDAGIILVDWSELFIGEVTGMSLVKAGKLARTFRLLRMVRLLRLLRMREVLGFVLERVSSERLIMIVDILKILFIMIGMAHFIACFWYALGAGAADYAKTWTNVYGFDDALIVDKYVMSLNWAIAQFAGGFQEVTAENPWERIFSMSVFLLAYLLSALFVSSLTSSMTNLNIIGSQQTQMSSVLRRFLGQNKISKTLAMRLQRNAQHAIAVQQRVTPESSVEMLQLVSEPLRIELHFEIYAPVLSHHPFFDMYIQENPHVMRRVCHRAASLSNVSSGDVIFTTGELPTPPQMYMVVSGTLRYVCNGRSFTVREHQWIAEAGLWTKWVHCGVLSAVTNCRICALNAEEFQLIATQFEHHRFHPSEYAAHFVSSLSCCDPVWDMCIGAEDWHCTAAARLKESPLKRKVPTAAFGEAESQPPEDGKLDGCQPARVVQATRLMGALLRKDKEEPNLTASPW